ncbi:MAG: hypothetical protein NTV86_05860, partial [Planctomycetota bacterium]|nr:hypothetical protein [Planctomycetota bacterium]
MAQCPSEHVNTHRGGGAFLALSTAVAICLATGLAAADAPKFVPTPKSVTIEQGSMPLTAKSRIVAADAALKPLAAVLA